MKKWQVWIGILLSIIFLWLAFRKIDFERVREALSKTNYFIVGFAFFLNGLGYLARAYRWQFILLPVKSVRFGNSFSATTIGFMANFILPMRIGELVRAFALGYSEKISKSASFATIIVERIFDIFMILLFMAFLTAFPFPEKVRHGVILVLVGSIIALCFLILLVVKPDSAIKVINVFPERINNKLNSVVLSFIDGLKILKSWKMLVFVFLLSLVIWIYLSFIYYVLFHAFKLSLPLYAAFVVMIIVCLGITIPSSPGFIGTYHYFMILGLSFFNVPKDTALSFALVGHLVGFLPAVFIGIFCLQKLGFSLREVVGSKD